MPAPFPGMDPYLEQDDAWHDFHEKFLPEASAMLVAQVRPKYLVKIDEHVYVHESADEPRRFAGRPDLAVGRSGAAPAGARPAGAGILEAPERVVIPVQDAERLGFLEIRDRKSRELVTVVELLSPANKRPGADRDQYLAKREKLLSSRAHLVEIDLLRGGRPMPPAARRSAYSVLVSRAEERPSAGHWPIGLRDPLPIIPVPLRPPDPDARLDLKAILDRVYDASGYEDFLYDGPPAPPLGPDDASWAARFVPGR